MSLSLNTPKTSCSTCQTMYKPTTLDEIHFCPSCLSRRYNLDSKTNKWREEYYKLSTKNSSTSHREEELKQLLEGHGVSTKVPILLNKIEGL